MTADTVGGVFTHAVDLTRGLGRADVEVSLVTFGRGMSADQRARVAAAGVDAVHETTLALEWMNDPWRDVEAAEELLLDIERAECPDVVHLNGFAHARADWRAPVLVAGHSCVLSWWMAVQGRAAPAEWERYRAAARAGLHAADAVVAPSATMSAALERWYGPLPTLAQTILNGSSYDGGDGPLAKEPMVVTAGRLWDEAKNVGALARVARRPALRGRVLLAGEGSDEITAPGVRALGPLSASELANIRRAAAVYAAPARYEPFGLGILEAARDRCALVLGDIPSLREIWGAAAVYVEPADDERLAWTLENLLADPARVARLGESAHRRAAPLTVTRMAGAYRRLYGRLVATARGVPA
jgi:glycosyltransferase involved in cell wall biosynthesis